IALDSIARGIKFYDEITLKIQNISQNPFLYRKRADDVNTRELIYKGYVIPFEIDSNHHKIIILGIFSQNLWN
ncbi:type II toxin-antitoxin system RelE/ParE family toxin, partial [Sulfuricurvum sp.]|uniref:type II toxin-antitoxin system RelE/ParE family toxin n=1 Tax=Sulfuricurvum sp. TaxID=2025608 RepID=UPI003BB6E259